MTDRNDGADRQGGADKQGGAVPPYGPPEGQPTPPPYGQQPPYGQPAPPPHGQQPPYGQPTPPPHGQQPYGDQPSGGQYPPYAQPPQGPPYGSGGVVPLWAPLYGAGPVDAVKRFFRKYADFSGRASRSEYWWVVLANGVLFFALSIVGFAAGYPGSTTDVDGTMNPGPGFIPFGIVLAILFFGTFVPFLSLGVRRLHDVDLSGWLLLISLVPYLGGFVIFILSLLGPKPRGARFDRPTA